MFAFMENKTMISSAVILLATEHNDGKTGRENENYKSYGILHYHKTEGAVY